MKNQKNKHGFSAAELLEAAARIEELDALEIVGEFRAYEHSCGAGTYVAAVLDPETAEISHINEPSWCCSADEYFGESGVMSRETLLSKTRDHWSPGPDDGFEWDYTKTDYWWDGKNHKSWITAENVEEKADELSGENRAEDVDPEALLRSLGWEPFGISDTPVDGWVPEGWNDYDVTAVSAQLDQLAKDIRAEAEKLDLEEEKAEA